jgi:hypothetical protein
MQKKAAPLAFLTIHLYSIVMPPTKELGQEIATLSAHLDAATHRLRAHPGGDT